MKYKVVETNNNPFGDYFEISNPSYHQTIQKHYVKTNELVLNSETSILLTEFRKDKDKQADNVLLYFCGYDDYFYHFHIFKYEKKNIDVIVVDIPGFGYNKRYPKNNSYPVASRFNFYDKLEDIVKYLSVAFDYIKNELPYENTYLYGHSTGGNIIINYLNWLQCKAKPIEFTRVLLCSPLTRFYDPSPIKLVLLVIFAILVSLIDQFFDINALIHGTNKVSDKTFYNKALNNIHGTNDLCYINFNYTGKVKQPAFAGWIAFVELYTRIIKMTKVQIDCPVRMVTSQSYGTTGYFNTDAYLNPEYMVEDCKEMFKNLEYRQFKVGHDALLDPSDNGYATTYVDILDYLLN